MPRPRFITSLGSSWISRQTLKSLHTFSRTWMWASGHNGHIRRAAHGYEPTREAAMAAFANNWSREAEDDWGKR